MGIKKYGFRKLLAYIFITACLFISFNGKVFADVQNQLLDQVSSSDNRANTSWVQELGGWTGTISGFTFRTTGSSGYYATAGNIYLVEYDGAYSYDYADRFLHWYGCGVNCLFGDEEQVTCNNVTTGANALDSSNLITDNGEIECHVRFPNTFVTDVSKLYAVFVDFRITRGTATQTFPYGQLLNPVSVANSTRLDQLSDTDWWVEDANCKSAFINIDGNVFDRGVVINTEPEPNKLTDPYGWLAWKIKMTFVQLFGFNGIDNAVVTNMQTDLQAKAPFAYGMAIYNLDMTSPTTSISAPALTFAFTPTGVANYTWTGDSGTATTLQTIRDVVTVLLWCLLIAYFVLRVRSFSEKL